MGKGRTRMRSMTTEVPPCIYTGIPNYEEKCLFGCDHSLNALFLFDPPLCVPGRRTQPYPGSAGDEAALGQQPAKPFLSHLVGWETGT